MRIRFTSPHPKDFNDEVLEVIAKHHNICKHLHMPAQSGSTAVLQKMRRGYTRTAYDALLDHAVNLVPGTTFSTDIIVGTNQLQLLLHMHISSMYI
jgi:tRNA A37 methylthiotransferase MiaB